MHANRISEDYRQILKSWQELDKDSQFMILSGMKNGPILFDASQIEHSDNPKLSEFYQVAKSSRRSTLNFDLLFTLQIAQKAYERVVDLDLLDTMASKMLNGYDSDTAKELRALRDPQMRNKVIEQSPWLKETILNTVQSYMDDTQVDTVSKTFLLDALNENYDRLLNRLATKFRNEHITCEERVSTEELNVHDVIFLYDADHNIYLESVVKSFNHEDSLRDPQVSTINAKGETNLRTVNHVWKTVIAGVGYLPANPSRNKIGLDSVWKNPESDLLDYEGMHHVFCGVEKTGDFRNPDVSNAYVLLLRDRLQGSLIAPYEMSIERTLQQWEHIINGPLTIEENYVSKNVQSLQDSFTKWERNLAQMKSSDFPVSVSGVDEVFEEARLMRCKIKKISCQKNVCFSETEEDDNMDKSNPSPFMDDQA